MIDNEVPVVQMDEVADHIDHVVKLVGIDYVGIGSDYDGVSNLPEGLTDVSMYPNLIKLLLERGYSEEDIQKIWSGNFLRIWKETEELAIKFQDEV
jgi:membrane dipeptidase